MPLSEISRGARLLVGDDLDLEFAVVAQDLRVGLGLETQLVDGVRRIGNQLSQEYLGIGIQRIDNDFQKLLDLCLELMGLSVSVFGVLAHSPHSLGCFSGMPPLVQHPVFIRFLKSKRSMTVEISVKKLSCLHFCQDRCCSRKHSRVVREPGNAPFEVHEG